MANVSFKKSSNKSANEIPNEINEGTIYITKEQEMYLDIDPTTRVQIAGNIIYKDLDNVVNPDIETELPPTFGGHTINDFLLKTGGTMTGNLILNGNPTENNQAVTKQYVDNSAPKIYSYSDIITEDGTNFYTIPEDFDSKNDNYDNLMIYQNGLLLIKNINYKITNNQIEFQDYALNKGETITITGPFSANANLKGEKGDPFTYDDFTSEQLAALEGKDGTSCTHRWDGTTLIVSSANGTTSADLGLKYTISNVDIGVGATLAKGALYFVYE